MNTLLVLFAWCLLLLPLSATALDDVKNRLAELEQGGRLGGGTRLGRGGASEGGASREGRRLEPGTMSSNQAVWDSVLTEGSESSQMSGLQRSLSTGGTTYLGSSSFIDQLFIVFRNRMLRFIQKYGIRIGSRWLIDQEL